jgi:hypothetical protein
LVADALIAIKGRGWKPSGLIDGAELSGFSDQPELTEVTLALLARTIGQ